MPTSDRPSEPLGSPWLVAALLVAAAASVSAWLLRYQAPAADAGALLTAASRLLRGGVFYRDVDAYPLPGSHYLLAGAMAVFGEKLVVARALAAAVFCGIVVALYACARTLLGPARAAVFGVALLAFKFVGWPSFGAYTYWDTAFFFACGAIALLLRHPFRGPSPALLAAGPLVGLAVLCKQNLGLQLAAVTALVLWLRGPLLGLRDASRGRTLAELGVFGAGVALPVAALAAWFASRGLLAELVHAAVVRPFTGYLPTSGIPYLEALRWWELGSLTGRAGILYLPDVWWNMLMARWPSGEGALWLLAEIVSRGIYTALPVAFAAAGVVWARARQRERLAEDRPLFVFVPLAASVVLAAFPRADSGHVLPVFPLVALLLFALWGRPNPRRALWAEAGTAPAIVILLAAIAAADQTRFTQRLDLPRAEVWVLPSVVEESVARYVMDEVPEGRPLFVYGHEAQYYFLSGRFSPWPFPQLYAGQTGEGDGAAVVEALRRDPPALAIRGMIGWPGIPPIPSYVPALDEFVRTRFSVAEDVFERYPLPEGAEPPPWWVIAVLRPCPPAPAECRTLDDFMQTGADSPLRPRERGEDAAP